MSQYKRFSFREREELSRCLSLGMGYRRIGRILARAASTILREVSRHSLMVSAYRAVEAQKRAVRTSRKPRRHRKLDTNKRLQRVVVNLFQLRWSPEQIAKRLRILYPDDIEMRISHEAIYSYLYIHPRGQLKRELVRQLRRGHKNRRVKGKVKRNSSPIQDYLSIDERPAEVDTREIAGHWEGDLIMGRKNKSAIGTLVERKTRLTLITSVKNINSTVVRQAFARKFRRLPAGLKKSLTYDQGREMADHKTFTERTRIKVYFAHPHSPWERGTSENTNSLIRDFFPKGTDFSRIEPRELKKVENMLNDRPRKALKFYTPREIFTGAVALEP